MTEASETKRYRKVHTHQLAVGRQILEKAKADPAKWSPMLLRMKQDVGNYLDYAGTLPESTQKKLDAMVADLRAFYTEIVQTFPH